MQYYEVPIEIIEDSEKLRIWVDKALSVAIRKFSTEKKGETSFDISG
jgi:TfoX/Sxy family transcriptional regulator of competence genes